MGELYDGMFYPEQSVARTSLYDSIVQPQQYAPQQQPQTVAQTAPQNANPTAQQGPYVIKDGPDYNKWDEALQQHGTIMLPRALDEPQQWLNQPHIQKFLEGTGVDRRDLPDGSVILSKKAFTS